MSVWQGFRYLRYAGGAALGATAVGCYVDEKFFSQVAIGFTGTFFGHFLLRGLNNVRSVDQDRFLEYINDRPKGTPLITVCNHHSTLDDPPLLSAMIPKKTLLTERDKIRWGACGEDVCFRTDCFKKHLIPYVKAGKVVSVKRGGGVNQKELQNLIDLVNAGEWVHIFPEGRVYQTPELGKFKRGVGKLVCAAETTPIILPFYHRGMADIMPLTKDPRKMFALPSAGKNVDVIFGEPVSVDDLLRKKDQPRYRENPDLLYQEIADRLQKEVNKLRLKLEAEIAARGDM